MDCIYAVCVCFLLLPQASVPCIRSSPVPSDLYTGLYRQYEIITMLHTQRNRMTEQFQRKYFVWFCFVRR